MLCSCAAWQWGMPAAAQQIGGNAFFSFEKRKARYRAGAWLSFLAREYL
jgi:hypothetical protein